MLFSHAYNDYWNISYEDTDDQRNELEEHRVSEGMITYWLLELAPR